MEETLGALSAGFGILMLLSALLPFFVLLWLLSKIGEIAGHLKQLRRQAEAQAKTRAVMHADHMRLLGELKARMDRPVASSGGMRLEAGVGGPPPPPSPLALR